MYGTMFRMKVKSGQEQKVIQLFQDWDRERKPKIKGVVGGLLLKPDNKPGEFVGAGVFVDKDAHLANANDPEQHQWFLKVRELLEADPEWEDGEFVLADFS